MKTRLLAVTFAASVTCVMALQARTLRGFTTSHAAVTDAREGAGGVLSLAIDSIDFRTDLTRVYGRIYGRPNTSQRIDAATLTVGRRSVSWTDVDGIEMKHYFQFEEDGMLPLEIDFPAVGASRKCSLTFVTSLGNYTYSLK